MSRALVLGHRGGRGEGWPAENTMPAFERALRDGADGVELDVRLCATGEVVVFHDRDLARATAGADTRPLHEVAWSELSRLPLFGGDATAPRLAEVLDLCARHDLLVNVELKYDAPGKLALARAVAAELRGWRGRAVLSSFDPRLLWLVRAHGVRAPRAWLTDHAQRNVRAMLAMARRPLVQGAHIERRQATPERVARLRARGLFVGVWTVNEPAEARALSSAGVRFVISDRPGSVRAALD